MILKVPRKLERKSIPFTEETISPEIKMQFGATYSQDNSHGLVGADRVFKCKDN